MQFVLVTTDSLFSQLLATPHEGSFSGVTEALT